MQTNIINETRICDIVMFVILFQSPMAVRMSQKLMSSKLVLVWNRGTSIRVKTNPSGTHQPPLYVHS